MTISPTQPNLAVAILMQAAPLLTSPNLGDRPTLGGPRDMQTADNVKIMSR